MEASLKGKRNHCFHFIGILESYKLLNERKVLQCI